MAFLPMTKIALKNLLTKPATRRYPFVVREPFPVSRGRIVIEFGACIFCGACSKHCPANSISVDKETKSWKIDRFSCVTCGACVRACPKKCLAMTNERVSALTRDAVSNGTEAHKAPDA